MTTSRQTPIPALLILGIGVLAVALWAPVARAQATQPAPSLDAILKEVALYDGGIDSGALWKLRDYVYARKDDPAGRAECETKLLAFLRSSATPLAKMAAGRHLRLIAGDTAVPALQALLDDGRSADIALYALQGIPGVVAEHALIQAVSTTVAETRTAVIAILGERRVEMAVPALVPLLQVRVYAVASATALGRIGGEAATAALAAAFDGASRDVKPVIASAILAAAHQMLANGNTARASRLYESVGADMSLPMSIREAAAIGTISTAGTGAPALVLRLLSGSDAGLREAAVSKIADVFIPATIGQVSALLSDLPEATRIQVIAVLATYPADRVGPAVLSQLDSESEAVRLAAMNALPSIGGISAVRPLAERAAAARGAEQAAARAALGMLEGRAVDEEMLARLDGTPSEAVAGELLLAVGERRNFSAKPLITSSLTSTSSVIRRRAYRALRTIGTPSDMNLVLDALLASQDEGERTEAARTVVALGQKMSSPNGRSQMVRARLATEKTSESKAQLIGLLGMMGDPAALPVLRSAIKGRDTGAADTDVDDVDVDVDVADAKVGVADADAVDAVVDAAVRAMAAWPTSDAREDLMALARDTRNETHRLLAIRGFIRTIGLDAYRDAQAVAADLRLAAGFAWRTDEQKLVLGVLGRFPCVEALDLARTFLHDPSLKAEAQAAIDRITPRLPKEAIRW